MKSYLLLATFCLIGTFTSAFGQQTESERAAQQRENEVLRQRIDRVENQMTEQADQARRSAEEAKRRPYRPSPYKRLPKKEIGKIRTSLLPSPDDFAKYKNFLQQPKTGLFRLMPNLECSQKYVIRASDDCQNSVLLGEFYSFRRRDYGSEDFFDLTFKNGKLSSGGFLSQGMLVSLGDIELEQISPTSEGVRFLSEFKPATESLEVKKQFTEIAKGINSDIFQYRKSENVLVNTTYGFRVIGYHTEDKLGFRYRWMEVPQNEQKFFTTLRGMSEEDRIDLTLAFRVVRKDEDGSLIVLWKELNRQKSPKIVFRKDETLTDISQ